MDHDFDYHGPFLNVKLDMIKFIMCIRSFIELSHSKDFILLKMIYRN